jgi:cation transport ATPase
VFWGAGIYAQAYRYRHVSGPAQRQQTKWVALSLGLLFSVLALGFVIPSLIVDTANAWFAWALLATVPLIVLFPVSVAIAVLRHRLYDIDRLITRTLTYGLLTVVLGILYAGAVVVLGQALNPRGGESALAVAASTLLVAALFQPLRRRIQDTVDRRFNRRRYDAARTIETFSARLRDQVDLDTLSAELLAVVDQTMQPTTVSLWLRPPVKLPRTG